MLMKVASSRPLSEGELLSRIAVRPPYYALRDVHRVAENALGAELPCEHPRNGEITAMTSSEAGRHLAILGACTAGMRADGDGPSFYLASRARLRCHDGELGPGAPGDTFFGIAEVTEQTEGAARARAHVEDRAGRRLKDLDVEYKILTREAFERIFSDYRVDLRRTPRPLAPMHDEEAVLARGLRRNPYRSFIPLCGINLRDESLTCSAGRVHPDFCCGHFPMFPALPVAIYLNTLARAAHHLLRHLVGHEPRYAITEVDMESNRLVFAGEPLAMRIALSRRAPPVYEFDCRASSGNSAVGRMRLALALGG